MVVVVINDGVFGDYCYYVGDRSSFLVILFCNR